MTFHRETYPYKWEKHQHESSLCCPPSTVSGTRTGPWSTMYSTNKYSKCSQYSHYSKYSKYSKYACKQVQQVQQVPKYSQCVPEVIGAGEEGSVCGGVGHPPDLWGEYCVLRVKCFECVQYTTVCTVHYSVQTVHWSRLNDFKSLKRFYCKTVFFFFCTLKTDILA